MENDLNKQELDKLIKDWTDGLLAPDIDNRIADSLINFVENDDIEIDVNDLLDFHIHQLATEENMTKRRRWRIFVSSVAAASVVILIAVSIFLTTREPDPHTDKEIFVAERQTEDTPVVINRESPMAIADSSSMILTKAAVKEMSKVTANTASKRAHTEKAKIQTEATTELALIEAIAEINAGLGNMVENTKVSMNMTNVSLLPAVLFSDDTESQSLELASDEYTSPQYNGQMQKLSVIESNLINALYEIRNLNIDLNFETYEDV